MRITVEVDEKTLKQIKKYTKIAKHSPAIGHALEDWLAQQRRNALIGQMMKNPPGYSMTNDELERALYGGAG